MPWRSGDYVDTALAHARLAGVPAERVINTWPLERLLEWAARRARWREDSESSRRLEARSRPKANSA